MGYDRQPGRAATWITLLLIALLAGCQPSATSQDNHITIGWTAWDDAEFVSRLAKTLIESHTDYEVDLELASIGKQYDSVADGSMDVMMMAWLPDTHARYWGRVKDRVVDLGTLYDNARLGWAVPDYVPAGELSSIADMTKPGVQARLGGRIEGIDPGAGLMDLSRETVAAYGLGQDYRLTTGNDASRTQALAEAVAAQRWVVVTAWTPHWIFARYHLRLLDDPKHALGKSQRVDVVARQGFSNDYPRVAGALSRMHIPLDILQTAMLDAQERSYPQAIQRFTQDHAALIHRWFDERPGRSNPAQ